MVPMNDLFYTRLHLGKVAFGFGILQRHFDFDDWEDLTDLDTEIKP
jgi:glucan biosynthesis protein